MALPLVWHHRAPVKARLAAAWTAHTHVDMGEVILTVLALRSERIRRDISVAALKARTAAARHRHGQHDSGGGGQQIGRAHV